MSEPSAPRLIGELLLAREHIRADDLGAALRFQAEQGGRIGAVLLRMGAVTAERLYEALSLQLGFGWLKARATGLPALRGAVQTLGVGVFGVATELLPR